MLSTHCLLLTTKLLTTHYSLLTTRHSPPTTKLLTTHCPGESALTLVQRAEELLERFIVPYAQAVLQQDSFGHTLRSRRAQAVMDKYRKELKPIFDFYAAADTTSADAREASASLNLAEVRLLLRILLLLLLLLLLPPLPLLLPLPLPLLLSTTTNYHY